MIPFLTSHPFFLIILIEVWLRHLRGVPLQCTVWWIFISLHPHEHHHYPRNVLCVTSHSLLCPFPPATKVIIIPDGPTIDSFGQVHPNCTVCTLLHPVSFTQHVFEVYPCCVSVLHSFLLLSRTPLHGDIICHWSIHPLRDIWVVASLELLEIKPLRMFLYVSSWDVCTLPILLKNPFLLEKTKAVWSGSKALIETN